MHTNRCATQHSDFNKNNCNIIMRFERIIITVVHIIGIYSTVLGDL